MPLFLNICLVKFVSRDYKNRDSYLHERQFRSIFNL